MIRSDKDTMMHLLTKNERYEQLTAVLDDCQPTGWGNIIILLNQIKNKQKPSIFPCHKNSLKFFAKGTAFITFSYGIDGVSVETAKYAQTVHDLFASVATPSIHFIGGNFEPQATTFLNPEWHTFQIDGIDGWDKWDDGKWFKHFLESRCAHIAKNQIF